MPFPNNEAGSSDSIRQQREQQQRQQQQQQEQQQWQQGRPSQQERELQQRMEHQQRLQQQQDPFLEGIMARENAPRPRKGVAHRHLSKERLAALRSQVAEQGVNLDSDGAVQIRAQDAEHAIEMACLLSKSRGCDLFRGQALEWPLIPSIRRVPFDQRRRLEQRLQLFRDWARTQEVFRGFDDLKIDAVAQHYGIPTGLLDFSENPRVAAFFATHTSLPAEGQPASLYCLNSGSLAAAGHWATGWERYLETLPQNSRVLQVTELYRMEAQEGRFVHVRSEDWGNYHLDIVRFPRSGPIGRPSESDIYPTRQSALDRAVEAYLRAGG